MNQNFDDAIKNKLYDYEIEPSASLWAGIEESIQGDMPDPKKKDNTKYFLLLLAFMSLVGISASSSYFILNKGSKNKETASKNIDANHFAMNYNKSNSSKTANYSNNSSNSYNSNYSNSTTNTTSSSTNFKVERVFVSNDNTKHIYLSVLPTEEKESISSIALENRLRSYKEMPTMYPSTLAVANKVVAFKNYKQQEEPIVINNRPNLKGIYYGASAQAGTNVMTANNTSNKMLGSNITYTPSMCVKGGLIVGYNINNRVAVQSGLSYMQNNLSYKSNFSDASSSGSLKLSYVELPIIVKIRNTWVDKNNRVNSVNVYSGMSYAYLTRAESKVDNSKLVHYKNAHLNAKSYLPNHNIRFIAGVEYQVYVKKNLGVTLGAEANYGGDAKQLSNWTQNNTSSFNSIGVGVNATITFTTKSSIK